MTTNIDKLAAANGIKPRAAYTVAQCATITGLSEWAIRTDIKAGRLTALLPTGNKRGTRIKAIELQRWFDSL